MSQFGADERKINRMARARSRSGKIREVPTVPQPTVLHPVVVACPADDPELSDADTDHLEALVGHIFTPAVRASLKSIAAGWVSHDRMLQSSRPKEFRKRLQTMRKALERVIEALDLHRTDAPVLDRHLLHWLLNASFDGAKEMLAASSAIGGKAEEFLGLLSALEQNLPVDEGRRRPKDDDRFIIHLANQFEASGGRATASRTEYTESGYRETAFRKFVHEFYKMIPIRSRRTDGGLDEAIAHALSYRHRDSKKE
jgi:hypothetical protein